MFYTNFSKREHWWLNEISQQGVGVDPELSSRGGGTPVNLKQGWILGSRLDVVDPYGPNQREARLVLGRDVHIYRYMFQGSQPDGIKQGRSQGDIFGVVRPPL